MKKRITLFVCFVLLAALLPLTMHRASAEETSGQCGDSLYWSFDESTGTLTITGNGDMWDNECGAMPWEDVTVEYVDSYGGAVLRDDPTVSLIHYIILPEGLTSIASGAFCGTLIESIEIPSTVKSILYMAFASCENLKSIAIPDGISKITWQCFSNCGQLKSVTLPISVTEICEGAFWDCNAITDVYYQGTEEQREEITFGDDNEPLLNATWHYESDGPSEPVTGQCGENLFWSFDESTGTLTITGNGEMSNYDRYETPWEDLKDRIQILVLPNGMTHIGDFAFADCNVLMPTTIPDSVTSIGDYAFSDCYRLTSFTIPDSVTSIGNSALAVCTQLTSITIPNSVKTIGSNAFSNCKKLTSITISDSVESIGDNAFAYTGWWNAQSEGVVYLEDILLGVNGTCEQNVRVKDGTRLIADAAFSKKQITTVTIPDSVTSIGSNVFSFCTGLTSVTIGSSVTSIGEHAFWWCTGLTEITIPDSVTSIGDDAFSYCKGLTSVTIGNSVTSTGDGAFSYCTALTSITIPDSVTSIGDCAFRDCTALTSITIPDSVTSIGDGAFYNCMGLTTVTIGSGVTTIGDYIFCNCTGLTGITIPDTVTSIGMSAFERCAGLTAITIPDSVASIGQDAFWDCTGLTTVTIGNSVTSIGQGAFCDCTGLTTVTIGSSVTSIDDWTFSGCEKLSDVWYNGTKAEREQKLTIGSNNDPLLSATWHYLTEDFEATVEWNSEDVKFKGATPYVIANGTAQTPRFVVKNAADGSVVDPANYDYEYRENTNAGTGYVLVTFKGDYTGTCRGVFKIYLPATTETTVANVKDGIRLTWAPVAGADGYVIYRRAWSSTTDGWTDFVRWNNTTGTEWTDTAVYAGTRYQYGIKAYFNRRLDPVAGVEIGGNVGDNYNLGQVGPLKTTVRITTRTLKSVTPGTKQLTVKWGGSSVFTGYQVQYATNSAFTKGLKTVKITNPKTVSTVIKSLKTGTTYYVRVRSYHTFNGMTYYGEWSNALSGKVK